jgi:hypothetical protein
VEGCSDGRREVEEWWVVGGAAEERREVEERWVGASERWVGASERREVEEW